MRGLFMKVIINRDRLPPNLWRRGITKITGTEKRPWGLGSHVGMPQSLCLLWRFFQHYCFCLLKPKPPGAHHPWQWAQTCPGPSLPVLAKRTGGWGGGGSTDRPHSRSPACLQPKALTPTSLRLAYKTAFGDNFSSDLLINILLDKASLKQLLLETPAPDGRPGE